MRWPDTARFPAQSGRWFWPCVCLLVASGAVLACAVPVSLPTQAAETPTPAPPAQIIPADALTTPLPEGTSPPLRSQQVDSLLEQVSAENLMGHVETLAAIHTRHVNSPTVAQAADEIYEGFQAAGGRWTVAYDPFPLSYNEILTTQRNVVATLPGTEPSAGIIVVGAHYDSRTVDLRDANARAPGGDDNATGVAALLEIARLLSDATPRATVMLVAFSAEEVGAVGSRHFVDAALGRGDEVSAMLQLDIVGNAAGPQGEGAIRAFSAPPDSSASRQLARFVDLQGQTYLPGFDVQVQPTLDRPGRYSDHVPFSEAGIPSMRLIEAIENQGTQHSEYDLPDTVSPGYLRQSAQLALASVVNLAYGPPAPAAPLRASDDTLTWSPVEGAAGYVLAFRLPDGLEVDSLVRVNAGTSLTWDEIAAGRYGTVSVAAVDAEGLMGPLSEELPLSLGTDSS